MHHSKFFKNDAAIIVPADLRQYLDTHFLPNLPNATVPHPKLLIVFSGGNAMGKSAISARLARDLQALVLENDDIRRAILRYDPQMDRDELNRYMWQYMLDLYAGLSALTPNGLVVRDGVIDWYHSKILPLFKEQGYRIFVIAFDLSREKRIELVKQRGDTSVNTVASFLEMIDDHMHYEKRFRDLYTPDVILDSTNLFDHDHIVAEVRKVLATLTLTV
jgi:predicted kinase